MSSYNQFSIQEVIPDASQKLITIKTNFKIDVNSVSLKTVGLYNYDRAKLENYKLSVDGKIIYIQMNDYPSNDSRYYLKIVGIKDALGRALSASYDDYIKFVNDIKTTVEIISPVSRETLKEREVSICLRLSKVEPDVRYRIEIGIDNVFFGKLSTIVCNIPNEYQNKTDVKFLLDEEDFKLSTDGGLPISFNEGQYRNDELTLVATIEREGQVYIRARAESSTVESIVGEWSEVISFNIITITMDSLETTFLEDYLTTDELFDDSVREAIEIVDRTEVATTDELFYLEFNKDIQLPEDYKLNADGFIKLGTIMAKRKEMK